MSNKNLLYEDMISERIHPQIEKSLRDGKHSLSGCDIFPEGDVLEYDAKLIKERFKEVVLRCREAFDVDALDNKDLMFKQQPLIRKVIELERPHKKKLVDLAVKTVIDEFNIPDGMIEFRIKLNPTVKVSTIGNETPDNSEELFDDNEEIIYANNEVKKRRVINAMIQGSAKKVNHIFHMLTDELSELNPRLVPTYKKTMSLADYLYFVVPDSQLNVKGGSCEVDFNGDEDSEGKTIISVSAMVFPVLIHELVKGVMEVLSSNAYPEKKRLTEYVLGKADFIMAEKWDMRLGPQIWDRFMDSIPDDSLNLKAHIYTDICELPYEEFNSTLKEIIGKTRKGRVIVSEIVDNIKKEMNEDDFNESMGDSYFDVDDLLN